MAQSNEVLQKNVQDAIKWEPLLSAAEIGVIVKDGVVTLTGAVDSYTKKLGAEEATKNVIGVKAVVEKIEVKFGPAEKKDDHEIATEILRALEWNWEVPQNRVKVKVENGWISLSGELSWNYQKEAAQKAIANLDGVKGVTNNISIKAESEDAIEKKLIEEALDRNWAIDNRNIDVVVMGTKVTLNGTVNSWYQKQEAGRIAWNAPGVWNVDNELVIEDEN